MVSKIILEKGNYGSPQEDRAKIGYLTGLTGVFLNIILAASKIIIGFLSGSISITADGFNNLSDTASSIVTIVGVKLSNKPADKDHPYGHGRIEYIAALVVSSLVIMVGVQFVISSFNRIIRPEPVTSGVISVGVLILSIGIKWYMSRFNKKIGNAIDSIPLKATAADCVSDVLVTSGVLLSLVLSPLTTIPVDGIIGILVSCFIILSGVNLIRETLDYIIGNAPSEEFIKNLHDDMCSYDIIENIHDIIVNNYGPEKNLVVLDAEINYNVDFLSVHQTLEKIERELSKKYNINLVIHVDAVGYETGVDLEIKNKLQQIVEHNRELYSFHDLLVQGKVVDVDITVDGDRIKTQEDEMELTKFLQKKLEEDFTDYKFDIRLDKRYFIS